MPRRIHLLLAAALAAPAAVCTASGAPAASSASPSLAGVDLFAKLKAGSPSALRSALADALAAREDGTPVATLMKDADYRRALAAHEVLRVTGDQSVLEFMTSRRDGAAFLAAFLRDTPWMESYLDCGRVPAGTPVGLNVLADIWAAESRHPRFSEWHALDCALASTWGAGHRKEIYQHGSTRTGIANMSPLWRYRFFRDRHLAGRLQPDFAKLKSWELQFVVGSTYEDASIAWLNENVNLPPARYDEACWIPTYRGSSDFGDYVQGPHFYRPWRSFMSTAESTKTHGGVCGSLSHFGAFAAASHGIPMMTVGQPGHCAYAYRVARGDWRGGFGGPDGWPGTAIWIGNIHHINLTEKVFGDDDGLNLALAHAARSRLFAARGDMKRAEEAIEAALAASPLHRDLHLEKIELLKSRTDRAYWRAYAESLLPAFGPFGGAGRAVIEPASAKFLDGAGDEVALAWFAKENAAYTNAPASWAWDTEFGRDVLSKQLARLTSPSSRERFFRDALAVQFASEKKPQLGATVDWGVKQFLDKGEGDAFGRAFASAASDAKGDRDALKKAYEKAIIGVEKARSLTGFQALATAASKFASAPDSFRPTLPPGRLVSDKGALRASSYAWDQPVTHLNVLSPVGGLVHTEREAAPHIIVTLPDTVELANVLVVKNEGNQERMKHMKAYRSTDGETWFPLAEVADMPREWRIAPEPGTRARWIKIESLPAAPEHLHLRNILVFAK